MKIHFPFSTVCPDIGQPCEMPELRSLVAMTAPRDVRHWQLHSPTPLVLTRWGCSQVFQKPEAALSGLFAVQVQIYIRHRPAIPSYRTPTYYLLKNRRKMKDMNP